MSEGCTWTSEEIKEIIKHGLSIELEYLEGDECYHPKISVKLLFDGEVIAEDGIKFMD